MKYNSGTCNVINKKSPLRGGPRTVTTSKVELFVIIVNGWKSVTIITISFTLDFAAVLDPPASTFTINILQNNHQLVLRMYGNRFKLSKYLFVSVTSSAFISTLYQKQLLPRQMKLSLILTVGINLLLTLRHHCVNRVQRHRHVFFIYTVCLKFLSSEDVQKCRSFYILSTVTHFSPSFRSKKGIKLTVLSFFLRRGMICPVPFVIQYCTYCMKA